MNTWTTILLEISRKDLFKKMSSNSLTTTIILIKIDTNNHLILKFIYYYLRSFKDVIFECLF